MTRSRGPVQPSYAGHETGPGEASRTAFADDVAYYLTQTPRKLPSRYLYDELGSSLFEAICRLPWYSVARTEQSLLKTHADAIFSRLPPIATVMELGPGSGEKLVTLMAASPGRDVTVHLVDVSPAALGKAAGALAALPSLAVVAHETTYEAGLSAIGRSSDAAGQALVIFLGSNIGNFDPPATDAFLRSVRAALGPGGALLLGTDLEKPESELLLAYDDPLGVTAAFNRNLLVRVNRELDGDFDVDQFSHRAVWNADESRVEMHLVSQSRQRVRVRASGIEITFDAGESIWTESSYKYRIDDLAPRLGRAGFRVSGQWQKDGFALTLARAR
jgi:L-histidine N-alpha-methyltransferase